jgi:hypothetical protein
MVLKHNYIVLYYNYIKLLQYKTVIKVRSNQTS